MTGDIEISNIINDSTDNESLAHPFQDIYGTPFNAEDLPTCRWKHLMKKKIVL